MGKTLPFLGGDPALLPAYCQPGGGCPFCCVEVNDLFKVGLTWESQSLLWACFPQ